MSPALTALTTRFSEAAEYARAAHDGQVRKGTRIPYISHPIAVSSLVLTYGGDEEQAIAGLLHDVLEDCGAHHEAVIRERFGERVARIVLDCTDGTAESKAQADTPAARAADWRRRKEAYLAALARKPQDTLLVSACDKLHNARCILDDLADPATGLEVFRRFKAGREGTLWYYGELTRSFEASGSPVAPALRMAVATMAQAQ
jgi:(p)ppGpp synthase/HD superfamily hydrolase